MTRESGHAGTRRLIVLSGPTAVGKGTVEAAMKAAGRTIG